MPLQSRSNTARNPEGTMPGELEGRKVAFLATDGYEEVELTEPWSALKQAGADVVLVSDKEGEIQGVTKGEKSGKQHVDRLVDDVSVHDFDALVIPGGVKNPDRLRMNEKAVALVRDFVAADKPVASICHGPWLLVEANAVEGRTLTSYPSLKTDIQNAGGSWVDKQVEVDQKLITSRVPDDLPAFCSKIVSVLAAHIDERRLDRMVEQSFPASDPLPGPISIP
jgi:protease I